MTTINEQVSASSDDCYELNDTSVTLVSDAMFVGYSGANIYDVGLRWQTVNIPNAATISSAVLSAYITQDSGTLAAVVKGIDEDNTATWSSASRPSQRSKTSASVSANEGDWGNWGVANWATLEIKTAIQEIINRGGWSANNALGIVIENTSGVSGNIAGIRSYDYTGNAHGAKLDITFTEGRATHNARSSMSVHSGVMFQTLTGGHGY